MPESRQFVYIKIHFDIMVIEINTFAIQTPELNGDLVFQQ